MKRVIGFILTVALLVGALAALDLSRGAAGLKVEQDAARMVLLYVIGGVYSLISVLCGSEQQESPTATCEAHPDHAQSQPLPMLLGGMLVIPFVNEDGNLCWRVHEPDDIDAETPGEILRRTRPEPYDNAP